MKFSFIFLLILFLSLNNTLNASAKEASYKADDIVNDLRYGRPVPLKAVKEMFDNLNSIATHHEEKSESSKGSAGTASSTSSDGFINGMEVIIEDAFPKKSREANIVGFISLLKELAPTIDPEVFEQGIMLIIGKLGY